MTTTAHTLTATGPGSPDGSPNGALAASVPRTGSRSPVGSAPAIPLTRLVRVELRKMVDTRSGFGILLAILLIGLAAVAVLTFAPATGSLGYMDYLGTLTSVLITLLPIIGVLAGAQEWSQRTTLQTFALEPRRGRVIGAKILAALALMVIISAVTAVFAASGHALSQAMGNETAGWGTGAAEAGLSSPRLLVGMFGVLAMMTLMGVAFGLLLHAPAIAIVAFLLLPQVFSVIPMLVPSIAGVFSWLDFQMAWGNLAFEEPTAGLWARGAVTAVLWVVLPMAAGWWRTSRREAA